MKQGQAIELWNQSCGIPLDVNEGTNRCLTVLGGAATGGSAPNYLHYTPPGCDGQNNLYREPRVNVATFLRCWALALDGELSDSANLAVAKTELRELQQKNTALLEDAILIHNWIVDKAFSMPMDDPASEPIYDALMRIQKAGFAEAPDKITGRAQCGVCDKWFDLVELSHGECRECKQFGEGDGD